MLQSVTDLDLVQQLKTADQVKKSEALSLLQERHLEYCRDYLVRYGVEEQRAQETLHSLLNQLARDPDSYSGGEDFRSWYKNLALKMSRAARSGNGSGLLKKWLITLLLLALTAGLVLLIRHLT